MGNDRELEFIKKVLSGEINKMAGNEILTLLVGVVAEQSIRIGKLEKKLAEIKLAEMEAKLEAKGDQK